MVSVERIRLREFGIGDGLSLGRSIWLRRLPTILAIVLTTYFPVSVLSWYLDDPQRGFIGSLLPDLAALLVEILGVMATIFLVEREVSGQPVDYRTALGEAVSRWLPGVGATLLVLTILLGAALVAAVPLVIIGARMLAAVLLMVPVIIVGVYYVFAIHAVVLRNRSGWDALQYGKSLVTGQWWRVFGYHAGVAVVVVLVPVVGHMLVRMDAVTFAGAAPTIELLVDVAQSLLLVAVTVFFLSLDHFVHPPEELPSDGIEP